MQNFLIKLKLCNFDIVNFDLATPFAIPPLYCTWKVCTALHTKNICYARQKRLYTKILSILHTFSNSAHFLKVCTLSQNLHTFSKFAHFLKVCTLSQSLRTFSIFNILSLISSSFSTIYLTFPTFGSLS